MMKDLRENSNPALLTDEQFNALLIIAYQKVRIDYFRHEDGNWRVIYGGRHIPVSDKEIMEFVKREGPMPK